MNTTNVSNKLNQTTNMTQTNTLNQSPSIRPTSSHQATAITPSRTESSTCSEIKPEHLSTYGSIAPDGIYHVLIVKKLLMMQPDLDLVNKEAFSTLEDEDSYFIQKNGDLIYNIIKENHSSSVEFHTVSFEKGLQIRLSPNGSPFLSHTEQKAKTMVNEKMKILIDDSIKLNSLPEKLEKCSTIHKKYNFLPFSEEETTQCLEHKVRLTDITAKGHTEITSAVNSKIDPMGSTSSVENFELPSLWLLSNKFNSTEKLPQECDDKPQTDAITAYPTTLDSLLSEMNTIIDQIQKIVDSAQNHLTDIVPAQEKLEWQNATYVERSISDTLTLKDIVNPNQNWIKPSQTKN